jgi:glycosyltransferase involved in cell wall biosynthesis
MSEPLRVLSLQPYYGGSHEQFQQGWEQYSKHRWTILTLPPRHWKWRMRHAAIYFAEEIKRRIGEGEQWDIVFCSDMLNLAEFRGLMPRQISGIPIVMFFHENQFAYPVREGYQRDEHLAFTNFTSALAADRIWFNSKYNFDSMVAGLTRRLKRWPDFQPRKAIESLADKLTIEPLGIEQPAVDLVPYQQAREQRAANGAPVHLVWAARWEHDKNADDLLVALRCLRERGVLFRLSLLGQSFKYSPRVFDEIQSEFQAEILRSGFQESRADYWQALAEADLFVSTAKHEFFGLAAAEGIAAGLIPLFPDRLAYPELLEHAMTREEAKDYLYDNNAEALADSIQQWSQTRNGIAGQLKFSKQLMSHLSVEQRASEMDDALQATVDKFRGDRMDF